MKKLVVLGAGESGIGAALLAKQKGWAVFVSDFGEIKPENKALLAENNIPFEEKTHSLPRILDADEVVKSPGIPEKAPVMVAIREKGLSVISEIEFAIRYTEGKIIAITGSNGKTTTTMLVYHMLSQAGLDVGLGGNVGISAALGLVNGDKKVWVYEISSFQLDDCYEFRPDIAIITNITPDHLDRYKYKFESYIDAKFRIAQRQTKADALVYCTDDPATAHTVAQRGHALAAQHYTFGFSPEATAWADDAQLCVKIGTNEFRMPIDELAIKGRHNTYNSMAAAITGMLMGLRKEQIRESLRSFTAVEHRLEEVVSVRGVRFINDSKATNVNSTWYALESMRQPTVLIMGGTDKGNDYTVLESLVREKVKAIVCLGVDNRRIIEAFGAMVPEVVETASMQEAVQSAYYLANPGDVVLLSPACASFDLFQNYEDRGRQFKANVRSL